MIDNYIYMYHTDTFIVLPTFAESVNDSMAIAYNSDHPLSRSAPIYSYANSGPRTVQMSFSLHRDMMTNINYGVSNANVEMGDDYVDTLIKQIQAMVLPTYDASSKTVNPPVVALRMGNDVFIKGVLTSGLNITYGLPILANGKYAKVDFSISVQEIDPYDAQTVMQTGSYRGISTTLERKLWKTNKTNSSTPFVGNMGV